MTWFAAHEGGRSEALALREAFATGSLEVVVPRLLVLEILNVAGRKWRWPADDLRDLATALDAMPFRFVDPPAPAVARWVAAGLTAYDASYVAVAEASGCTVVTTDTGMLTGAPALTTPLVP